MSTPITHHAETRTGESDVERSRHGELHREDGVERGDRADRSRNPVINVEDLAWLEFTKPDLDAAERFAHDFGFATAARTADVLYLRGTRTGGVCVVIRRGVTSSFLGPTFRAIDREDVARLAAARGRRRQAGQPHSVWRACGTATRPGS